MASERSSILYRIPARALRRRPLLEFARRLEDDVADGRAFDCLITDDGELRRLNRQFRGSDSATDVLSFTAAANGQLGEIAISLDRAREQAARYGHSVDEEVRVLMLHGVLHLTGMDHERDHGEMRRIEQRWRRRLNLPAALIERVDRPPVNAARPRAQDAPVDTRRQSRFSRNARPVTP
ncbi:MAG: rRNA maturation RNase YbeY [Bryobacteraceae bacterium]|jgi:probable rRNA maturation factor